MVFCVLWDSLAEFIAGIVDRLRSREIFGMSKLSDAELGFLGAELKFTQLVLVPAQAPPPHQTIPVNGTLASATTVTLRLASVPVFPAASV